MDGNSFDEKPPKQSQEGLVSRIQNSLSEYWGKYRRYIAIAVGVGILVFFHVYAGFAIAHSFHTAKPLVVLTCLAYAGLVYFFIVQQYLLKLEKPLEPLSKKAEQVWNYELCGLFPIFKLYDHKIIAEKLVILYLFNCFGSLVGFIGGYIEGAFLVMFGICNLQQHYQPHGAVAIVLAAFLIWIIIDSKDSRIRLRSVAGMAMYLLLAIICSANPARIKWRPVICSLILQFCIGLIVLKWPAGHSAFQWLSNKVVRFLDYTANGTSFTYGLVAAPPNICGFGSVFIYTSLQIIIYFGAIVSVLYYLGVIEFVLSRIAWLMQYTLGTTAAESLNAAACIFLGQTEAAILIEPALNTMTESEIHAVMSAGFACIAGSLFSAYISFGACPSYLLSATVMSAAVSLAVSKIIYPEIQVSRQKSISSFKFKDRGANNILECISNGACHSSKFVWAIGANLIVYLALLALLNTVVWWLGDAVSIKDLSFNKILGYCFFPLAYMMGASDAPDAHTQIDETLKVAELMGMKTVLNEFIAYQHLHELVENGELVGDRARMIATYALCGFSNISMIGSQMGILSSMCPHRKSTFAKVVIRALIAGCISCFMTACVAGILVTDPISCESTINANCLDLGKVERFFNTTRPISYLSKLMH